MQANSERSLQFRKDISDKETIGKLNGSETILRNLLRKVEFMSMLELFDSPQNILTIPDAHKLVDKMKDHFPGMIDSIVMAVEPQGLSKQPLLQNYLFMSQDEAQAGKLGKQIEDEINSEIKLTMPRADFYTLVYRALADYLTILQ